MNSALLCKLASQFSDASIDGHVNPIHPRLAAAPSVDHGGIDWLRLPLGEGEGYAHVGVKGAGAGGAGGADEGRAELALEEILDEAVVALQVRGENLGRHLFVRPTHHILEGGKGGREGEEGD